MNKDRYHRILNLVFILMTALTFYTLYMDIIALAGVLAVGFLMLASLHVRDFLRKSTGGKKLFVITLLILVNFCLTNAVVFLAEYIYPYS